ncbi:MAG: hypothetical protein ACXVCR_15785 [Bdellovibrio sp.]
MKFVGLLTALLFSQKAFCNITANHRECLKAITNHSSTGAVLNSGTVVYPGKRSSKTGFYALKAENLKGPFVQFCELPKTINSESSQFAYYNLNLSTVNPDTPFTFLSVEKSDSHEIGFAQHSQPPSGFKSDSFVTPKCEASADEESEKQLVDAMREKIVMLPNDFLEKSSIENKIAKQYRAHKKFKTNRAKNDKDQQEENNHGTEAAAPTPSLDSKDNETVPATTTGSSSPASNKKSSKIPHPSFINPASYINDLQVCAAIPSLEKDALAAIEKIRGSNSSGAIGTHERNMSGTN